MYVFGVYSAWINSDIRVCSNTAVNFSLVVLVKSVSSCLLSQRQYIHNYWHCGKESMDLKNTFN